MSLAHTVPACYKNPETRERSWSNNSLTGAKSVHLYDFRKECMMVSTAHITVTQFALKHGCNCINFVFRY